MNHNERGNSSNKPTRMRKLMVGLLSALAAISTLGGAGSIFASQAAPLFAPDAGNWEHQTPLPVRLRVAGVDMLSATEGWVVSEREIVHTTDGGVTWQSQPQPVNDALYSVQFFDSMHGVIGSNNTVLYTSNGGQTWQQGAGVVGSIYYVEMSDASTAWATYGYEGYFKSTDGGATWTHRTMPSAIGSIQFFDANNGVALSPGGVYHTTNRGDTWTFTAGQGGSYFINHNQGWRVQNNEAARTTDGGATWQPQTLPAGSWVYDSVFTDANNGWGVGETIVRTTDGGNTWVTVPVQADILPLWAVDFADAQHGIVGGDVLNFDTYIATSSNGGATWTKTSHGTNAETLDLIALDSQHVWASHVFGKLSRTTDGGATWLVNRLDDPYSVIHSIDMADMLNGWAAGQNEDEGRIYHTTDGGVTWQRQFDNLNTRLFAVDALSAQTAIIVGGFGNTRVVERTTDGGNSWQELSMPLTSNFFMDIFFLDANTGWITGNNGQIGKTTDGGTTWVVQNTPFNYGMAGIHFSDPQNGWAGGYYQKLLRTTNGGATWTEQNPGIPEYTHVLAVAATGPNTGWIVGYGGGADSEPFVKHTTNGGATWIDETPAVGPYDSFSAISFLDDNLGWAGGFAGIFKHTATGSATATPTTVRTNTPVAPSPTSGAATSTVTRTAVATSSAVATSTSIATSTPVAPSVTVTRQSATTTPGVATSTATTVATGTVRATSTAVASTTATVCAITFTDVPAGHTFYPFVRCLACQGILGGYEDGTFRPDNLITRGQIAKIVSNAAGINDDPGPQMFADVDQSNPFYSWINRLAARGHMGGYPCGGPGEPCGADNLPYFRPFANATRGQIAKIVSNAAGFSDVPTGQMFEDVPADHTFYVWVQRLASRGYMGGYPCGGPGEPCGIDSKPYFRPYNNATRGQTAKIVSSAFFPNCNP